MGDGAPTTLRRATLQIELSVPAGVAIDFALLLGCGAAIRAVNARTRLRSAPE
jgi:hypothetical protein